MSRKLKSKEVLRSQLCKEALKASCQIMTDVHGMSSHWLPSESPSEHIKTSKGGTKA